MVINRTKMNILSCLAQYQYLSAVQLTRLLYGKSLKMVQQNLAELLADGYVQFVPYWPPSVRVLRGGRARRIYTFDRAGYAYVKGLRDNPAGRFRPSERSKRRPITLEHTLAANDLLILSHIFCKRHPEVQVARFETEAELKRHPVYIGEFSPKVAVIPDAWMLLVNGEDEYGIAWELDRATENRGAFCEKIRMLVYYSQGPYTREFAADSLTIAIVAAEGGVNRVRSMHSWTEAELTDLGAQALSSTFLFAAFNPEQADPDDVFLSPIWWQPFAKEPVSLVEG